MIFLFYTIGSFISASMASFFVTLADRILIYFYGSERKNFSGMYRWKEILTRPSHCQNCKKNISNIYLTPVLGYIFTVGKCNNCKIKLSPVFLITELFFVINFLFVFYLYQDFGFSLILNLLFGFILVVMITDIRKFIIDYEMLFFIIPIGLFVNYLFTNKFPNLENLYVFLGFLSIFGILHLLFKRGMGFGDVLLAPVLAGILGHPFWMIYLNTATVAAVCGAILSKYISNKKNWKSIPFGFYLGAGFIVSYIAKLTLVFFSYNY